MRVVSHMYKRLQRAPVPAAQISCSTYSCKGQLPQHCCFYRHAARWHSSLVQYYVLRSKAVSSAALLL
jgi:hypothetical protein